MVGTNLKPFIPILISRLKKLESCFLVFSLDITLTSFKFPTIIITVQTINKLKHDKSILTFVRFIFLYLVYRFVQTKALYFVFHPKVVLYNFFPYFSSGVDSRPGRFFRNQYGSTWTIYYAPVYKNHRGVLCHKISSSDTAAVQERFWQKQCTW